MPHTPRLSCIGLLSLLAVAGCAAGREGRAPAEAAVDALEAARGDPPDSAAADRAAPTTDAAPGEGAADAAADGEPDARSGELAAVIAQLEALGTLDPASRDQLIDDLQRTDPSLWPVLLTYFRASAAGQAGEAAPSGTEPAVPGPQAAAAPRAQPAADDRSQGGVAGGPVGTGDAPGAASPSTHAPTAEPLPQAAHDQRHRSAPSPDSPAPPAPAPADSSPQPTGPAPDGQVASTAHVEPAPALLPWAAHLAPAISALEADLESRPPASANDPRPAQLRLLYLLCDRRDDAVRPAADMAPAEQAFWSAQALGLATLLDVARTPDAAHRAAQAVTHLREAAASLAETAPLVVRNLTLCREVDGYGVLAALESDVLRPGQSFRFYAEIENFRSESRERGWYTALRTSYQVLDAQGRRVEAQEFAVTEDSCRNRRRDFFIRSHVLQMPERVYDGRYTLVLTVEDVLANKVGQASVEFTITAP